MSLQDQFATNSAKEIEGVEIQYGPNKDGSVPTFHISRASKSNKAYTKALEKGTRPYRRQIELGTMNNETAEALFMTVFIQTVLKGWQNVQVRKIGADGKPTAEFENLDFNETNARRLFLELPELYEDLQEKSKQASLFRDESLEDEAKN